MRAHIFNRGPIIAHLNTFQKIWIVISTLPYTSAYLNYMQGVQITFIYLTFFLNQTKSFWDKQLLQVQRCPSVIINMTIKTNCIYFASRMINLNVSAVFPYAR